jgi:hypothetical protein
MGGAAGTTGTAPSCHSGQSRSCADEGLLGTCAGGIEECTEEGQWGPCSVQPAAADTCEPNNDDTCNGSKNEGCACTPTATRPCSDDGIQGTCAAGTETCAANGQWGACSILPAVADTCASGNDDTCNGTPNEDCTCLTGATRACSEDNLFGKCAAGTETCGADGEWGACSIQPAASDTCAANNDNNCNGIKNEGCGCVTGTTRPCSDAGLKGPCAAGTQTCSAGGTWGTCSIPPGTDTCVAGNDNSCDGIPNQACLCIEGVTKKTCGVCSDGQQTCTDGKAGNYGSCTGGSTQKTYYLDSDGDGYGNASSTTTVCGGAPGGYVTNASDCCDSDNRAKPGGNAQAGARIGCGGYDFNCDGQNTQSLTAIYCSNNAGVGSGNCTVGWGASTPPGCGATQQSWCYDGWNGDSYSTYCDPVDQKCY